MKEDGKLHSKLVNRTRTLFVIATILFFIVLFNVLFRGVNIFFALLLGTMGFILSLFIFSKMNVINWSEEDEVLKSGKMDTIGFVTLGLYIFFEIAFRTLLKDYFTVQAVPLLLSVICGTLFGRGIGTLVEMHRVYKINHD